MPVNLVPTTVGLAFVVSWVLVAGILLRCRHARLTLPEDDTSAGAHHVDRPFFLGGRQAAAASPLAQRPGLHRQPDGTPHSSKSRLSRRLA